MMRSPLLGLAAVLLVTGCAGSSEKAEDTPHVAVRLTDKGCDVDTTSAVSGGIVFDITNPGTTKVSEVYVKTADHVLAEKESITPGKSGSVTLTMSAGDYFVRCPGGTGEKDVPFTVTEATGPVSTAVDDAEQKAAAAGWADYVRTQVAEQVAATKALTHAVRKGDLAAAAAAYAGARVNYERIEPVAEAFGDIDPAIDLRIADVTDPKAWTGYHRLEKAIFADRSLAGMSPIATTLDADVARLQSLVETVTFAATDLANGAGELLNEVGASKITGEEEAYSHLDLVDFQANVDGARKAFELLTPALEKRGQAALIATITARLDDVDAGLKPYRTGDGPTAFRAYSAVPRGQHRVLATLVDAAAEPLSTVGALLVEK